MGWVYSEEGCELSAIRDRGGYKWDNLYKFNIKDDGGGDITVRIFRRADLGETYLFFPGSKNLTNFQTDFNIVLDPYNFKGCNGCKIHRGFLNAWTRGRTAVINNTKFIKNVYPNDKLVIVGGSLGGALASLAFADFMSDWSTNLIPTRGVSFGQPRVGNAQWASFMNGLTSASNAAPKWQRVTHQYGKMRVLCYQGCAS